MARIYLASSWRNEHQPYVLSVLRSAGHRVYDFRDPFHGGKPFAWTGIDSDYRQWTAEDYKHHLLTSPVAAHGFVNDLRAMQWADACVLLLPCGRSAHLEAGWFCGQGKRCIILTQDGEEPELMALLATDICTNLPDVLTALEDEL